MTPTLAAISKKYMLSLLGHCYAGSYVSVYVQIIVHADFSLIKFSGKQHVFFTGGCFDNGVANKKKKKQLLFMKILVASRVNKQ